MGKSARLPPNSSGFADRFGFMPNDVSVVCAWCPTAASGSDGRVSHGICVACAMEFLKKLPREYLQTIAEPDGTVTLFSGHKFAIPGPDESVR